MGGCRSGMTGHRVLLVVSWNEVLPGLVNLVCSGNRWIPEGVFGLHRFCRAYVCQRWFFRLISGFGQGGGVSFLHGSLCPLVRFVQ